MKKHPAKYAVAVSLFLKNKVGALSGDHPFPAFVEKEGVGITPYSSSLIPIIQGSEMEPIHEQGRVLCSRREKTELSYSKNGTPAIPRAAIGQAP